MTETERTEIQYPVPSWTGARLDVKKLPSWDEIPERFKDFDSVWHKLVSALKHSSNLVCLVPRKGVKLRALTNAIKGMLEQSGRPKRFRLAICAMWVEDWVQDVWLMGYLHTGESLRGLSRSEFVDTYRVLVYRTLERKELPACSLVSGHSNSVWARWCRGEVECPFSWEQFKAWVDAAETKPEPELVDPSEIKALITKYDVSQRLFARAIGFTHSTVNYWVKGERGCTYSVDDMESDLIAFLDEHKGEEEDVNSSPESVEEPSSPL